MNDFEIVVLSVMGTFVLIEIGALIYDYIAQRHNKRQGAKKNKIKKVDPNKWFSDHSYLNQIQDRESRI